MQISFKLPAAKVGRKYRYIPHSLNHGLHFATRGRWTKEWKDLVWAMVLANKKSFGPLPLNHPTVKILMHSCQKIDRDNAWSASKPIIDGLRFSGVLVNDREEDFECDVKVVKADHIKDQGVEVIIEFEK